MGKPGLFTFTSTLYWHLLCVLRDPITSWIKIPTIYLSPSFGYATWIWLSWEVTHASAGSGQGLRHISWLRNKGEEVGAQQLPRAPCRKRSLFHLATISQRQVSLPVTESLCVLISCFAAGSSNGLLCSVFCPFTQIVTDADLVGTTWFQEGSWSPFH